MAHNGKILIDIAKNILYSIYQYCHFCYYDQSYMQGGTDIVYKDQVIGVCEFKISVEIIEKEFLGDWDYPPYPEIIKFRIEEIKVVNLIGSNNKKLEITENALNEMFDLLKGTELRL